LAQLGKSGKLWKRLPNTLLINIILNIIYKPHHLNTCYQISIKLAPLSPKYYTSQLPDKTQLLTNDQPHFFATLYKDNLPKKGSHLQYNSIKYVFPDCVKNA
jgi:hypothetical protein